MRASGEGQTKTYKTSKHSGDLKEELSFNSFVPTGDKNEKVSNAIKRQAMPLTSTVFGRLRVVHLHSEKSCRKTAILNLHRQTQ